MKISKTAIVAFAITAAISLPSLEASSQPSNPSSLRGLQQQQPEQQQRKLEEDETCYLYTTSYASKFSKIVRFDIPEEVPEVPLQPIDVSDSNKEDLTTLGLAYHANDGKIYVPDGSSVFGQKKIWSLDLNEKEMTIEEDEYSTSLSAIIGIEFAGDELWGYMATTNEIYNFRTGEMLYDFSGIAEIRMIVDMAYVRHDDSSSGYLYLLEVSTSKIWKIYVHDDYGWGTSTTIITPNCDYSLNGIAIHPQTNVLYGIGNDNTAKLYKIDDDNGTCEVVATARPGVLEPLSKSTYGATIGCD